MEKTIKENNKNTIKIACATDDNFNFSKEHFGSASKYLVYSLNLDNKEIKFLKEIKNITSEERKHGDPNKAKAVSEILKEIDVLINSVFGPNIVNMRKNFVSVVSRERNIEKALKKLINKIQDLRSSLNKEIKDILYIEQGIKNYLI